MVKCHPNICVCRLNEIFTKQWIGYTTHAAIQASNFQIQATFCDVYILLHKINKMKLTTGVPQKLSHVINFIFLLQCSQHSLIRYQNKAGQLVT
jgi:hypothetical protein